MTNYDLIASEYKRSKLQPWRLHIESFNLFRLLGDLTGKRVLDLACGEGFYSRLLKRHGAAEVVGIDCSRQMIELARAEEQKSRLGIDYLLGDAKNVDLGQSFNVVTAAYLLNYAETADELLKMCRAAARHLKPDGRFVGVNNNPEEPAEHFASSQKYGFVKHREGEIRDGAAIVYTFFLASGPFELTNYYLSLSTHERVLRTAGFGDINWPQPVVSPEGVAEFGAEFWMDFLECPPVLFFEARKT